ncbi:unnamed protein product [Rhodiola kirilowii]
MEETPCADYRISDGGRSQPSFSSSGSIRDVNYSCGSCGYELNLNSSNRNTTGLGSKYRKSLKRGIISFTCIDESRFTQVDENQCVPNIISKYLWGLLMPKTKLLCRKCGNYVGEAYRDRSRTSSYDKTTDEFDSTPGSTEVGNKFRYNIRIRSLQPSAGVPFSV